MSRRVLLLVCAVALAFAGSAWAQSAPTVARAPVAVGDLDADGRRDRAVVVEEPAAGALPRVFIAVFAETAAGWRLSTTVRLERGAVVDRLDIATGRLTAAFRRHYPVDPPGRPSNRTVRSWAFVDGGLHGGEAVNRAPRWGEAVAARLPR